MPSKDYVPNLGNNSSYSNGKMNQELAKIAEALQACLSRYSDQPNQMESDLDMNSNQILNLLDAVDPSSPVTLRQLEAYEGVINGIISDLESKVDQLEDHVDQLDDDVQEIKDQLQELKNEISVLEGGAKAVGTTTISEGTDTFLAPAIGSDNPQDYFVFVQGVYQNINQYTVQGQNIVIDRVIAVGLSVSIVGYRVNVVLIDGDISIPVDREFVDLESGQRALTFGLPVQNSAFRLSGVDVDDGDLFEDAHYQITGTNTILLKSSYPEGSRVTMAVPTNKKFLGVKRKPEPESERLVIAHRGFADLAPENTLAAISQAYSLGAGGVEFDVMCTSDGVPVLMHDDTVDRTTDGTGNLYDLTLAQVQQLDAGSWFNPVFNRCKVPTLEDTLKYCRGRFKRIHLEIKGYQWSKSEVQNVTDMVKRLGVQGVVIYISYNRTALNWVREYDPSAAIGYIDASRAEVQSMSQNLGGELYCSFSGLSGDPTFPEYARSLGVNVFGKVFNSMEQHEQGAIEYGLTTIHSDNACGATRRYSSGTPCPLNSDYSNATKAEVAGGTVTVEGSDLSDQKLVVNSNSGGRAALEFGMFYDRLGEITVGFFASLRSYNGGTFGVFQDASPYLYDNTLEVFSDDVLYYETTFRTYLNSSRSDSEVDHRPLIIGGGSAADGECEFFRFRILNDSKYKELSGVAKGTIRSDSGVYSIHRVKNSYGILDINPDGSIQNEINVKLDAAVDDSKYTMSAFAQVRGSTYESTHFCTVQGFFQNTLNLRVHRYDGTAVDVSTLDGLFIDLLVS